MSFRYFYLGIEENTGRGCAKSTFGVSKDNGFVDPSSVLESVFRVTDDSIAMRIR